MVIARDIIPKVRIHLAHPSPQKVRVLDILGKISFVLSTLGTELKLVDQRFYFLKAEFNVRAGKPTFPLALANYSKYLSVEWINPQAPDDVGVEIQVTDWDELDQVLVDRPRMFSAGGITSDFYNGNIASAIAFQGLEQNLEARVTPTPLQDSKYRIYYEPTNQFISSIKQDLNFPQEWIEFLAIKVAKQLLGNCGYEKDTYYQLRDSLNDGIAEAQAAWEWWKRAKHQSSRSSKGYSPPSSGGSSGFGGTIR
jgi:hypothetical protein